jgi:HSP20 family molecular chaperone IbpA
VDQVNSKLKAMLKKVQEEKQRKEEQRKKFEMDERAKQTQPQQQQEKAAEKDRARSEGASDQSAGGAKQPGSPKGSEMWRSMKLKPKFEMAQTHDATILQAHIPGMREEDIEIERDEDGQSFTVKGLRVPTPAEEAAMRRQLKSMLARDPWGLYYPQGEKERDLLTRMGAGRYGSFSETFEVSPDDVDLSGISASYTGGVLRIVVPIQRQKQQKQQPQQRQARAQPPYGAQQRRHRQPRGYGGYPEAAGGPQGFFNDKAFWW